MDSKPRKLFVLVGYPLAGTKRTLQHVFDRKHFFPFKRPFTAPHLNGQSFVVINASNSTITSAAYLAHVRDVLEHHIHAHISFAIGISLVFDNSEHDVRPILQYLHHSRFDVHYLLLYSCMDEKRVINEEDLTLFRKCVQRGKIDLFDLLVSHSTARLDRRSTNISRHIQALLKCDDNLPVESP
ncbi:hypothetical protein [Chitinophaga nivalis]|uniref:Uncharacterized protein n=1 Tax=Chitinophaga nivalis TaxID=2991709 RepID=A0ABT3IVB3_9BACT|nr:hypothetical protein [Chitinophaga nivalis]MCW3462399.1 hypothetical protein [Chitinophaga nivalis]MCW3487910.1 hypothetical protein [Chitinophaga nivalis]